MDALEFKFFTSTLLKQAPPFIKKVLTFKSQRSSPLCIRQVDNFKTTKSDLTAPIKSKTVFMFFKLNLSVISSIKGKPDLL
jgi:hypothetical protein